MEFAEKSGITVIGNYIDRALSAKTDNRPEFQKMIKDSYRKVFDSVIVLESLFYLLIFRGELYY